MKDVIYRKAKVEKNYRYRVDNFPLIIRCTSKLSYNPGGISNLSTNFKHVRKIKTLIEMPGNEEKTCTLYRMK